MYVFRNEFFNLATSAYKMNREPAGLVVAHNTSVKLENGTSSTAGWQNTFFRNNVIVGTRYAAEEYGLVAGSTDDWDYDALGATDRTIFVKWNNVRYSTVAELRAAAGIERHGLELPRADALAALVKTSLPPMMGFRTEPGAMDLRPAPGSPLIDAGAGLVNLNEPFVVDGRPDLGAFEAGQPAPPYGPRTAIRCAT